MTAPSNPSAGCGGGCAHCAGRPAQELPPDAPCGARLGVSAFLVFVVPLCGALAGATRLSGNGSMQALGALAGFFAGVLAAQLALIALRRLWRPAP